MFQRSQRYIHMQNMKSHYQRLRKVEPVISFADQTPSPGKIKAPSFRRPFLQRSLEVDSNNRILLRNLNDIGRRKPTSLYLSSQNVPVTTKSQRRKLHPNKEADQIDEGNKFLFAKLMHVLPEVGTKQQWKQQHKMHKYQIKRMARHKQSPKSKAQGRLLNTVQSLQKSQLRPFRTLDATRKERKRIASHQEFRSRKSGKLRSLKQRYFEESDDQFTKELKDKFIHEIF